MSNKTMTDARAEFESWAKSQGLIRESYGLKIVASVCDTAWMAWQAARLRGDAAQPAAPAPVAGDAVAKAIDYALSRRKDLPYAVYDELKKAQAALTQDRASQGCGACGDGCRSREACRLADESPSQGAEWEVR